MIFHHPVKRLLLTLCLTTALHAQQNKPAAFSLRPAFEKLGLKPTTQGYNACTVFATLGVIEFDYAKVGAPVKFSEQFTQWAAVESAGRRYLNFPYRTVISGIQKHGLCREDLMPYKDPRLDLGKPSEAALRDAGTRRNVTVVVFHEYNKTFGFAENVITAMCDSLAEEKAVVCCIRWPQSEAAVRKEPHTFDTKNSRADLKFTSQGGIGHAVTLVGYERNGQWEGGGRFEFRNSFGETWGHKGYGWVTFEYVKTHGVMAYAVHGFPQ